MFYNTYGTASDTTSDGRVTYYRTVQKTSLYSEYLQVFTLLTAFGNPKVVKDYHDGRFNVLPECQVSTSELDLVISVFLP